MTDKPGWLSTKNGLAVMLTVYAQPKAAHTQIAGVHGDALKIRVAAPPIEGKANEALIKFLAKLFRIPKSAIMIQSGEQSRTKHFLVKGLSYSHAKEVIEKNLLAP